MEREDARSSAHVRYEHRQTGWTMLGTALIPFACLIGWWSTSSASARTLPAVLLPMVGVFALVIVGFSWLTVVLTDTRLVLRFGIGLVRRTIPLATIASATIAGSRWYEGWGIHWTRRGMLYNVGGFETVAIRLVDGRMLRIGSDDAQRLQQAIEHALAERRPPR